MIRSRAQWVEEGERSTSYFLNLEKRNKLQHTLNEVVSDSGRIVTGTKNILTEAMTFYQNLYTKDLMVNSGMFYADFNHDHVTLSEDQMLNCEGPLTLDECFRTLCALSLNKTPGTDGLPVEFYKTFWPEIGHIVINSFNKAFDNSSVSLEQGRATITLIPKLPKDKRF